MAECSMCKGNKTLELPSKDGSKQTVNCPACSGTGQG